jgi:hypothetical protein
MQLYSWYGIRLELDAVLNSGYGYCESVISEFTHTEVRDARYGFKIEGTAPRPARRRSTT